MTHRIFAVLWVACLGACSTTGDPYEDDYPGRPCDPKGVARIDLETFDEELTERLFPRRIDTQEAYDARVAAAREYVVPGKRAIASLVTLGRRMKAHPECVPDRARPNTYLECIGVPFDDPLIGHTVLHRLSRDGQKADWVTSTYPLRSNHVLLLDGFWDDHGCGAGKGWGTQFRIERAPVSE